MASDRVSIPYAYTETQTVDINADETERRTKPKFRKKQKSPIRENRRFTAARCPFLERPRVVNVSAIGLGKESAQSGKRRCASSGRDAGAREAVFAGRFDIIMTGCTRYVSNPQFKVFQIR
jgi:hypothetical protein